MTDFEKFALALYKYQKDAGNIGDNERNVRYVGFQEEIKDLRCNDFRYHYFRAHYLWSVEQLVDAKENIDKAILLVVNIDYSPVFLGENLSYMWARNSEACSYFMVELPPIKTQIAEVYSLAGTIYAMMGDEQASLKYYQMERYYKSFLKSEFETEKNVSAFSFRRFNEHSLSDLINNTITVSPSAKMNDPFDSIINLWGNEERLLAYCKEKKHVKPMSDSFNYYRIRAFCLGTGNSPIRNTLMWSHYSGEHTGFCVKYKLSKHFICQEENNENAHMYLKRIKYTNRKISISVHSLDSDLAFATKKLDWKYENEVRLIVYNPNESRPFYGIELDDESSIDSIFFGYMCAEETIRTVTNIFLQRNVKLPKFYKMVLDENDIYKLKYIKL